ncbi:hypothetical protein SGCOL_002707 [Colletotrichum sp. CLE4]
MDGSNISSQLKDSLAEKPWFGFDLDDTLHEFRRASSAATAKTLEVISQRHGTSLNDLEEVYAHVLRDKTASAFSDGKKSFEYRRERFASVLDRFGLPSDDAAFLDSLLDVYERTLNESLQLKDGAESLLKKLKVKGKKVAVITEGPQDAQERTVKDSSVAFDVIRKRYQSSIAKIVNEPTPDLRRSPGYDGRYSRCFEQSALLRRTACRDWGAKSMPGSRLKMG